MKKLYCLYIVFALSLTVFGGLEGFLSTPGGSGLVSGGKTWLPEGEGLRVAWEVSLNADDTWHYRYSFFNSLGSPLKMDVSHFIITVSQNLGLDDVFHFSDDAEKISLGDFGTAPSNPGFPSGQPMHGLKIDMGGQQQMVEFDSVRSPMWGDIYVKGGGNPKNFAYNRDLGLATANLHDFSGVPVDDTGAAQFKVLVPNTNAIVTPEPATLAILGLGGLCLVQRRIVR
ncbi:MAG: PEP-CTERM sorting domain-containing protein [Planctomycetaceae bacterium]|nr:PEP-CTERM sorting domain-containing protein [Planctomycetaceae bacterium]